MYPIPSCLFPTSHLLTPHLTHSLTLSPTPSHPHTVTLTLSPTYPHPHTLTLTLSPTLSLSPTHLHPLTHTPSPSHLHTLTLTHTHSPELQAGQHVLCVQFLIFILNLVSLILQPNHRPGRLIQGQSLLHFLQLLQNRFILTCYLGNQGRNGWLDIILVVLTKFTSQRLDFTKR